MPSPDRQECKRILINTASALASAIGRLEALYEHLDRGKPPQHLQDALDRVLEYFEKLEEPE